MDNKENKLFKIQMQFKVQLQINFAFTALFRMHIKNKYQNIRKLKYLPFIYSLTNRSFFSKKIWNFDFQNLILTDRSIKKPKMPKTPEQYDDIRKQKKQLIMDTALELFAENGFHATSISQIAKAAKISKGLTYNYFTSKNEILEEIMEQGFNEIYDNLDMNRDGVLTEEEFIFFIRQNFKLVHENMQHWKLFFSLLLQPKVATTFSENYTKKAEPIFGLFHQFIVSAGSKNPEQDLMAVAAMIEGAFLYLVAAPDVFPAEQMEQAVIENCLRIIKE